jgi:hypothetical protein
MRSDFFGLSSRLSAAYFNILATGISM